MKIVLATGGSGGHVFPAIYVGQELRSQGHDVIFAGALSQNSERISREGFPFIHLTAQGLRVKSFSQACKIITITNAAFWSAWKLIGQIRPDRVCGFGGYGGFALVLAGALRGFPTMIHEQNVIPGKANRWLGRWVKKVAVSFPESRKFFSANKTVWTGCPCRADKDLSQQQARQRLDLDANLFTILVLGGSQGSHRINEVFSKVARALHHATDFPFQVIHLAGTSDYEFLKDHYEKLGLTFKLYDFCDDMGTVYGAADLVISRAGALTVTELAQFGLPAILIPYPYAGAHQHANARILVETTTAKMIEEAELSAERLEKAIRELARYPKITVSWSNRLSEYFRRDASKRLAEEITQLK